MYRFWTLSRPFKHYKNHESELVNRNPYKVDVAGSTPVLPTIFWCQVLFVVAE
jgi:hypothetical protein